MQKTNFKRLLAVVLSVMMMLSAIPFSSVAADETPAAPKYVVLGSYNGTPLVWEIIGIYLDTNYVLISKDVIAKEKFGGKDYAAASIFTALNNTFYNTAFTDAEKAIIVEREQAYESAGSKTVKGKVHLPSLKDVDTYSLGAANLLGTTTKTEYWLADLKTGIQIQTVNVSGGISAKGNSTSQGYRAMVTIAKANLSVLNAAENVTYTTTNDVAVDYVAPGAQFKVSLDANYSQSAITVTADSTELIPVDGVYTAPATGGQIKVSGVVLNPADYTLYNTKVEMAAELNEDDYSADSWAALQAALAVDVSGLTILDQAKVDEACYNISTAMDNLLPAPADFTAYDKAVADADHILANLKIFDATGTVPGTFNTYEFYLKQAIKETAVAEIHAMLKADQAKVDEATAYLQGLIDGVGYRPANIDAWVKAVETYGKINKDYYEADYVDAVWAIIDQVVEEQDFREDRPTIIEQDKVDDATDRMNAVIGKTDDHMLPADFSALEEAIAIADTYLAENYYKDDDVKRDEEKGGTAAWVLFEAARNKAKETLANKDKVPAPTKKADQKTIDEITQSLVDATLGMDQYIKLNDWDRFVKDVKYFFSDAKYEIEGFIKLLKFVFELLGMVFSGEISLYDALADFGVDQEILDIVEKLGFKPTPEVPEEVPEEEPAA